MHRPMVEGPCGHGRGADEPLTRFPPTTFPPRRSSESGTGGPKSELKSGSPSEPDSGSPGPPIEGKLNGARNASPFRSRNASSFWSRFLARVARIFRTGMAISGHTSPAVFRTNIFRFLRPTAYTKCTTRAPKMGPWALHRQRNSQAATVQVGRSPPGWRREPS